MIKKNLASLALAFGLTASFVFAEGEFSVTLDFSASALEVEKSGNETNIDSFADSAFEDSELSFSYEGEKFGGVVTLGLPDANLHLIMSEDDLITLASFSELYGWIKPFGSIVKFTAGIFENTDGIADYTDDIDDFDVGVFILGDGDEPFAEPMKYFSAALVDGFLTDLYLGPMTVQLLFGPNLGKKHMASEIFGDMSPSIEDFAIDGRQYRLGARVFAEIEKVGTFALMFKTFQWPKAVMEKVFLFALDGQSDAFTDLYPNGMPGDFMNYHNFGAYADITAAENLGIMLGYTGYVFANSDSNVNSPLFHGIDLRATWTGVEGLSLSTHNNVSFAFGSDDEWDALNSIGAGNSFFNLYNAVGATKTLTDVLSVNAQIGNILSKISADKQPTALQTRTRDEFWAEAKLIASVTENTQFKAGLKLALVNDDVAGSDATTTTTFSIPVGVSVNF
ncbi:MAG: hypothetical protein LBE74_05570 [Treponema sp.]|jgi:hypothetical protein|nr:hypothetical protein [Treponema sp.]